jgi:Sec-independent protein translocase protein TatA
MTIFSFASLFLFLAVLPLVYAPETLPEKVMKDRDLKSYLEKAQKIAKKEGDKKTTENKKQMEEQDQTEDEKNNKDYDEARKLAEKYY